MRGDWLCLVTAGGKFAWPHYGVALSRPQRRLHSTMHSRSATPHPPHPPLHPPSTSLLDVLSPWMSALKYRYEPRKKSFLDVLCVGEVIVSKHTEKLSCRWHTLQGSREHLRTSTGECEKNVPRLACRGCSRTPRPRISMLPAAASRVRAGAKKTFLFVLCVSAPWANIDIRGGPGGT